MKAHLKVKQIVLVNGTVHWGIMDTAITGDSTYHAVWGFWSRVEKYLGLGTRDIVGQALTRAIVFKPVKAGTSNSITHNTNSSNS